MRGQERPPLSNTGQKKKAANSLPLRDFHIEEKNEALLQNVAEMERRISVQEEELTEHRALNRGLQQQLLKKFREGTFTSFPALYCKVMAGICIPKQAIVKQILSN